MTRAATISNYIFWTVLLALSAGGCGEVYNITSDPPGAYVAYFPGYGIAMTTPCQVMPVRDCIMVDRISVTWTDGTSSPWRMLNQADPNMHFVKPVAAGTPAAAADAVSPAGSTKPPSWEDFPIVDYEYNSQTGHGILSVQIGNKGIEARHWIVTHIGEICSDKNVVLEAGKENRKGGMYKVLNESVKQGVLTIEFEAIY